MLRRLWASGLRSDPHVGVAGLVDLMWSSAVYELQRDAGHGADDYEGSVSAGGSRLWVHTHVINVALPTPGDPNSMIST